MNKRILYGESRSGVSGNFDVKSTYVPHFIAQEPLTNTDPVTYILGFTLPRVIVSLAYKLAPK